MFRQSIRPGTSRTAPVNRRDRRQAIRAAVEGLESRQLLSANLVVNSTLDNVNDSNVSGPTITLREAVNYENANGGGTITFASNVTGTIMLASQLDLSSPNNQPSSGLLTITGPGAGLLTISGGNATRVFVMNHGAAALSGLTISGGNASYGAGLAVNSGTVSLTNVTVANNTAQDGVTFNDGGGISTANPGTVILTNTTIANNSTIGGQFSYGGGLINYGNATLNNVTFVGNSNIGGQYFNFGGAMVNYGTTTLVNVTMTGNASGDGAGLWNDGTATLADVTIAQNSGSGIDNIAYQPSTFTDTLVAQNSGGDVKGSGFTGNNDFFGDGKGLASLTNSMGGDPLLGTLGNYGGPTQTIPLLAGSPAIGAGVAVGGITTDQRGVARAAPPSIGAYEYVPSAPNISAPVINAVAGIAFSTAVTFTDSNGNPLAGLTGITVSFPASSGIATLTGLSTNASGQVTFGGVPTAASTGTYTVSYSGSPSFLPASASNTLAARLCNTQLVAGFVPPTALVGNNVTFGFSLRQNEANNSTPLSGQSVRFTVTDPTGGTLAYSGTVSTNASGAANYSFTPNVRGVYSIAVSFAGNATFASSSSSPITTAVYEKTQLVLSPATVSAAENDTAGPTMTAVLTDAVTGGPLPVPNIYFTADGIPWMAGGVAATSTSGNTASYTFLGGFSGMFPVTAKINAADAAANYYADANGNIAVDLTTPAGTVTINKAATSLFPVSVPASATIGNPVTLQMALDRISAPTAPLGGQTITFTETDPTGVQTSQTATTAANGSASVHFTPTAIGGYSVVASYTPASPYPSAPAIGAPYSPATSATNTISVGEVPSLVVTTTQDVVDPTDSQTSLREAITYAEQLGGARTITFASNVTGIITLGGAALELNDPHGSITIAGPGANVLAVSGHGVSGVFTVDAGTVAEIDGLTVTEGRADHGAGINNMGSLTVNNDEFSYNATTGGGGGGIYTSGLLNVNASTFAYNETVLNQDGAGVQFFTVPAGIVGRINNSTFYGNNNSIGAIWNSCSIICTNDTVVGNDYGLVNYGLATVNNSILVGGYINDLGGNGTTTVNNSILGNPGMSYSGAADQTGVATGALFASNSFGFNGGTTPTLPLLAGSPAVNAGSNALAVDANGNLLATDQRGVGYPRIVGGAVDIGAYESPYFSTSTTVADAGGTYTGTPYAATGSTILVDGTIVGTPTLTYYLASDTNLANPLARAPINAGNYVVVASYAGQGNYLASSNQASFSITPATPAVTAIDAGGTYNGSPFAASATVAGVTGNPLDASGVTYTYYTVAFGGGSGGAKGSSSGSGASPKGSSGGKSGGTTLTNSTAVPPTDAGNYAVVAHYPGSTDGNYAANDSGNTYFTIGQASPTLTVTAPSQAYAGLAYSPTVSVTDLNGQSLGTPTVQYFLQSDTNQSNPLPAPTSAGAYTVVVTYAGSTDYAYATASANFSITAATPAVTVVDNGGVYTGNAFPASATVAGVAGTVLDASGVTFTYYNTGASSSSGSGAGAGKLTVLSAAPVAAGNYAVVAHYPGTSDGNYAAQASTLVLFTITRATPTVSVTDSGGTYNGNAFPATATVAGVSGVPAGTLEGVAPTLTYYAGSAATGTPLPAAPVNAGTYTVLASFAGSADYVSASKATTFTIGQAASAVSVTGLPSPAVADGSFESTRVYGFAYNPSNAAWTFSGNAGIEANNGPWGAATAPDGTQAAFLQTLVGVAGGSLSQTLRVSGGGSYAFSFAAAQRSGYAAQPITVLVDGTVLATITPSSSAFQTYVTPAIALPAGQHVLTFATAAVASTSDAASFVDKVATLPVFTYSGSAVAAGGTVSGAGGLSTTPSGFSYAGVSGTVYGPTSAAPVNAGTYTVTATYAGDANHAGSSATALFAIGRATPTVSVTDSGGTYNGNAFSATATVAGVSGVPAGTLEGVAPTLTYYAGSAATGTPLPAAPVNAGTYTVLASFAGSADYVSASKATTFTIGQAASVLSVPAVTVGYGGTALLSATLTTASGVVLAGRTVTFTFNGNVVGTAVTNGSGVATLSASAAGLTPGVRGSGIGASFGGDANSTATATTTSLTVQDAPIVGANATLAIPTLTVGRTVGAFTQARAGATASDFVATVNWGDGSATQTATVVADLLHPGQFDIVGPFHLYANIFRSYTVTVTVSTVAKFGAAGATATFTTVVSS